MFIQGISMMTLLLFLAGCAKDENITPQNLPISERGGTLIGTPSTLFYGLSDQNEIAILVSGPPAKEMSRVSIGGLRDGENILAIDIRPATRQLYGVSNFSMLYVIDPNAGTATPVSVNPFSPEIAGNFVGFDFDPKADRIRLVTNKDQNLRINPTTGVVESLDFPLNPATPSVNAIAYSSYSFGFAAGALFDIDITEGMLYRQNPIAGTLTLVGPLGLTVSGEGGFDISRNNSALAVLFANGRGAGGGSIDPDPAYRLYSINLKTGGATSFGKVKNLIGIAIP